MSPPREYHLAGLELSVYGFEHLSSQPDADVAVAFALHGRTSKRQTIDWAAQKLATDCAGSGLPLIVVTLDQRNHGSRTADPTRNLAWREKPGSDPTGPPSTEMFNPSHALDMIATFSQPVLSAFALIRQPAPHRTSVISSTSCRRCCFRTTSTRSSAGLRLASASADMQYGRSDGPIRALRISARSSVRQACSSC